MRDPADANYANGSGRRSAVDVAEADEAVRREFAALTGYLATLRDQAAVPPLPSISTALAPSGLEEIARWSVVLRGVRRLTEVAELRAHLLRLPRCINVRVVALSSREIRMVLTATARLDRARLEEHIADGLRQQGSAATFDVLPAAQPAV
ncbi:MAG: hypothetical protein QJR03_02195 [Sphaerobacter sp.]|nr:hypothetical protein [Sphaerobacter sp.]